MVEPTIINTLLVTSLTNILSGIFIGAGIAFGAYFALKRQMPKWIHEITNELIKIKAIDHALEVRKKYQ